MQQRYGVIGETRTESREQPAAGFTLVELLTVIVIIGILSALSVVAYTGYQRRSVDTAVQAAATTALDAIKVDHANANADIYPDSLADVRYTVPKDMTAQYVVSADKTRFCVQVKSNTHIDITYFAATTTPRPQSGTCPASGY